MNRKLAGRLVRNILLIGLLGYLYLGWNDRYFTPEQMMYFCQRGHQRPPSEQIDFAQLEPNEILMSAHGTDYYLIMSARRDLAFLWRPIYRGYREVSMPVDMTLTAESRYLCGLCLDPEITSLEITLDCNDVTGTHPYGQPLDTMVISVTVEEDGYFFVSTGTSNELIRNGVWQVSNQKAYNQYGELVFSSDEWLYST